MVVEVEVQRTAAACPIGMHGISLESKPSSGIGQEIWLEAGPYVARLAVSQDDLLAVFRLRFLVFNLELNEGLESSFADGYDVDRFDAACEHLMVEERATGMVVGTYRVQTGGMAALGHGYYSEQEFDFAPYEGMRAEIVELGRACTHRDHRTTDVLHLLWRAIARYALARGGRYMIGCCSLTSQDCAVGQAIHHSLAPYSVEESLRTEPRATYAMEHYDSVERQERAPKLLRAYLAIGARICGPPAIDREFKTIDFLTLLDLERLHPRVAAKFLGRV